MYSLHVASLDVNILHDYSKSKSKMLILAQFTDLSQTSPGIYTTTCMCVFIALHNFITCVTLHNPHSSQETQLSHHHKTPCLAPQ